MLFLILIYIFFGRLFTIRGCVAYCCVKCEYGRIKRFNVIPKCQSCPSFILWKSCGKIPFLSVSLSVNWRHIHWPSFGKEENKRSVLLWYSCFHCSILMFLMREGLQDYNFVSVYWNTVWWCCETMSISWLLFAPLPKLGQLGSGVVCRWVCANSISTFYG